MFQLKTRMLCTQLQIGSVFFRMHDMMEIVERSLAANS